MLEVNSLVTRNILNMHDSLLIFITIIWLGGVGQFDIDQCKIVSGLLSFDPTFSFGYVLYNHMIDQTK